MQDLEAERVLLAGFEVCAPSDEWWPYSNTGEVIVFTVYFRCVFSFPVHTFLHELLDFYEWSSA